MLCTIAHSVTAGNVSNSEQRASTSIGRIVAGWGRESFNVRVQISGDYVLAKNRFHFELSSEALKSLEKCVPKNPNKSCGVISLTAINSLESESNSARSRCEWHSICPEKFFFLHNRLAQFVPSKLGDCFFGQFD